MDGKQLMEMLRIKEGTRLDTVVEKLFCYALVQQETAVIEEVLRDYRRFKKAVLG